MTNYGRRRWKEGVGDCSIGFIYATKAGRLIELGSLCVAQVICHGIPDMRELQEGDIVNIDVSTFVRGYHGDLNEVRMRELLIDRRKK